MKILVVDDDNLVSISLKTILEAGGNVEVLAIGNSGEEAIDLYEQYKPDILLMDIRMNGMTGLEAAEIILKKHPDALILFLTTFSDDEYVIRAINIGAKGYILKQDFAGIETALNTVMGGQSVLGNEIVSKLPSLMPSRAEADFEAYGLNKKEEEIIILIADGLSNKEISSRLFLSEGTVRNYISTILEKLELRDRTQLAVFYYQKLR